MGKRTFNALIRRGFDSETANRLDHSGYSLSSLKSLNKASLRDLGISDELIQIILQESRPPIPAKTLNKILYESRMTCCVCRDRKQGIVVHHIHEFSDSRSHAEENLVVLCLNHHGEAHTKRELQLNLTPSRLRDLKARWLEDVQRYDRHETFDENASYSYEAIKKIARGVHYSTSFHGSTNAPKFSLRAEELSNGTASRRLVEEESNETVWDLIQFPKDGYATKTVAANNQLIISNFGASCVLLYCLKSKAFSCVELDSYEAGRLALLSERKKFGEAPVIRKYPPGDLMILGDKLFVGQVFSEFVVVIDVNSKSVIKRVPVGGSGEFSYCSNSNLVYFASNDSGTFFIIDPMDYHVAAVPYPEAGLHIGSTFCHPDSGLLYLAVHRTRARDLGTRNNEANCFIAVYDPFQEKYIHHIDLIADDTDKIERCWASGITYDPLSKLAYIGMLGSSKNIYILDTEANKISGFVQTQPNNKNKKDHVDSLSVEIYQDYLLSVNRSNYELEIFERSSLQSLLSVPLGGTGNGPRHICVQEDRAYISHSEYAGVISADLNRLIALKAS